MADIDLSRRIIYPVTGAGEATVRRGLKYRGDEDPRLLMDVYVPRTAPSSARLPAIVFIPGGPIPPEMLAPREWGFFISYGELAVASGLVGVVFNHRLHAPTDYETAQADVTAAVDYVRKHADDLGIDPDRLALWAFSGGGPLLSECLRTSPPYVRCLVAFYAVMDLRRFVGPDADAARLERAARLSPAVQVAGTRTPIFVARAGLDTAGLNESIDTFVSQALSANVSLDVANHPAGHHAFDVLDDNVRSREIIARALEFVRARVK
jgi:acetyl esterase/lipase